MCRNRRTSRGQRSQLVACALALTLAAGTAEADYAEIERLAAKQGSTESTPQARQRWSRGLERLDQLPHKSPDDYRHCFWSAVLRFRLDGPDAAQPVVRACTLPLIAATLPAGVNKHTAEARAGWVNKLNDMIEEYYKAENARLALLAKAGVGGGSAAVTLGKKQVKKLRDAGKLTQAEADALLQELDEVEKPLLVPGMKIDPALLDYDRIDWGRVPADKIRFDRFDLDKLPPETIERLRNFGTKGGGKTFPTGGGGGGLRGPGK